MSNIIDLEERITKFITMSKAIQTSCRSSFISFSKKNLKNSINNCFFFAFLISREEVI